jgi:hypothetical protein
LKLWTGRRIAHTAAVTVVAAGLIAGGFMLTKGSPMSWTLLVTSVATASVTVVRRLKAER